MQPSLKQFLLEPDRLVVGSIFGLSILALALLSEASVLTTVLVLAFACLALWIYRRIFGRSSASKKPIPRNVTNIKTRTLETLADALPRAIIVLDRNAIVLYANEGAFRLLSPDMIGKPIGAYLRATEVRS